MMYPHQPFEDRLARLSITMKLAPADTAALVIIVQMAAKINGGTEAKIVDQAERDQGFREFLKDKCKELLA